LPAAVQSMAASRGEIEAGSPLPGSQAEGLRLATEEGTNQEAYERPEEFVDAIGCSGPPRETETERARRAQVAELNFAALKRARGGYR
jgi:hypothetical protein